MDLKPYIGLPFGTGPGQVTCWSLVCRFYADQFGIELPEFGDIDPRDLAQVARAMHRAHESLVWREPRTPVTGDVVAMRSARGGRAICHVGILADCRRVLHAEEDTGSVLVPIDHFTIRSRIAGFRRYVRR
jgi:cell wall-associated NlpC family hydrolase